MKTRASRPRRQSETEFDGEYLEFSGRALSPDDPSLEVRVRRGRPGETKRASVKKKVGRERS